MDSARVECGDSMRTDTTSMNRYMAMFRTHAWVTAVALGLLVAASVTALSACISPPLASPTAIPVQPMPTAAMPTLAPDSFGDCCPGTYKAY